MTEQLDAVKAAMRIARDIDHPSSLQFSVYQLHQHFIHRIGVTSLGNQPVPQSQQARTDEPKLVGCDFHDDFSLPSEHLQALLSASFSHREKGVANVQTQKGHLF